MWGLHWSERLVQGVTQVLSQSWSFGKSSGPVSQPASTRLKFLDLLISPVSYCDFLVFCLGARWRDNQSCSLHLSVVMMLSLKGVCTHACPGHVCSTEIKKNQFLSFLAVIADVLGQRFNWLALISWPVFCSKSINHLVEAGKRTLTGGGIKWITQQSHN